MTPSSPRMCCSWSHPSHGIRRMHYYATIFSTWPTSPETPTTFQSSTLPRQSISMLPSLYTLQCGGRKTFGLWAESAGDGLSFFCVFFISIGDIYIPIYFYMPLYLARANRVGVEGLVAMRIWPTVQINGRGLIFFFLFFFSSSREQAVE